MRQKEQRNWTPEEDAVLRSLYCKGYRVEDIAKQLNRTEKGVYHRASTLGLSRFREIADEEGTRLPKALSGLHGNFAVTSDWHIPYFDTQLSDSLLNVCAKKKVRKLIIAGDLLNLDAVSTFLSRNYDINEELRQAERILQVLSEQFAEVYVIPGNHDFRLARKLEVPISFEYVLRMFCNARNVATTEYDFVELTSGEKRWRVCHPKNYSQIKGRIAYRLAGKYECNVVSAHGHFFGMVVSESGKYLCVDSGGMFDKGKIDYFWRTTTYPDWNQGFVLLIDGIPELYSPLLENV